MSTKTETKIIEELVKGFELHEVIKQSKEELLVAVGHKNHNFNKLVKYDKKIKTSEDLKVNGDVSFKDFVALEK